MSVSEGTVSREWSQAASKDKTQWAETDAQKFSVNMKKNFFTGQITGHWNRLYREEVEFPLLEIFKNHLDEIQCQMLWNNPA